MNVSKQELVEVAVVIEQLVELDQAQLALIGGGCGEVVWS